MAKNNESTLRETPDEKSERLKREGLAELAKHLSQTEFGKVQLEFTIVNGKVTMCRVNPEYTRI